MQFQLLQKNVRTLKGICPRGMIYSLIICTVLYVLLALVLTGMVSYTRLNVGDRLAMVFDARGLKFISGIVAVSAIIATASVLLVFQLGQPRIWMSMSRDGLLPKIFSRIHPRYGTPSFSTILTGYCSCVPALFLNLRCGIIIDKYRNFICICTGMRRYTGFAKTNGKATEQIQSSLYKWPIYHSCLINRLR